MKKATLLAPSLALALAGIGCGAPAAPFDRMPQSQVMVYRLQNYEPPPTATAPAAGGLPLPLPIPPEITSWMGGGANGLPTQAFCGFGLPLPGCTPGPTPGVPPAPPDAPRFHNFRILGQASLGNEGDKEDLAKILGREGNFEAPSSACMYPEYGVSFGSPQNDLLISLSCHKVEARSFQWPFGATNGIKGDTQEKLANVFKKLPLY